MFIVKQQSFPVSRKCSFRHGVTILGLLSLGHGSNKTCNDGLLVLAREVWMDVKRGSDYKQSSRTVVPDSTSRFETEQDDKKVKRRDIGLGCE